MTSGSEEFEFDVAFSFLAGDEALAQRLNDLVQDRLRTFLYSKKQEDLAGRDGEEIFSGVFARRSRVVVILYRDQWGHTPWTRIERDAIRNRAFDQGYDFTLWVPLDQPPEIPDYVPKTRLYANIERFGETGIAAVISNLATERGASAHVETLEQRTARAKRAVEAEQRRQDFHRLGDGVVRARASAICVIDAIKVWAEGPEQPFRLEVHRFGDQKIVVVYRGQTVLTLMLNWWQHFTNSTEDSHLEVKVFDGVPQLPGKIIHGDATELFSRRFSCDLSIAGEVVWRSGGEREDAQTGHVIVSNALEVFMKQMAERR